LAQAIDPPAIHKISDLSDGDLAPAVAITPANSGEQIMREPEHRMGRQLAFAVAVMLLAAGTIPIRAMAASTFTWDPAAIGLSGAGSAFTANGIVGSHYLYDITPPAGSAALYTVSFIEQITGFTVDGGTPFSPPGLNGPAGGTGSYGLYLSMQAQVQQAGSSRIYHSLTMSLMADPGNNNGAVSSTLAHPLAFANTGPSGTMDDITLATGSLISGTFQQNPAPGIIILSHFMESFTPTPSKAGFFASPVPPFTVIEEFLTTPVSVFNTQPLSDGSTIAALNGGMATIDLRVPEPASLLVLAVGLTGIAGVRRMRNRRPR
jgi:hypothetical protein